MITEGHVLEMQSMIKLCSNKEQALGMQAMMEMLCAYDEDETPCMGEAEKVAWLESFMPKCSGEEQYMVLCANNVDTDITVLGPYKTWQEARDILSDEFADCDEAEGQLTSDAESMSFFDPDSNDFYYGRVERVPTSEKEAAPSMSGIYKCHTDWVVDGVLVCKEGKEYKFEDAPLAGDEGYCDILGGEDGKTIQTTYLEAGEYFHGL